jgi:cytoskeletal protein CcmA (bactofilin family)
MFRKPETPPPAPPPPASPPQPPAPAPPIPTRRVTDAAKAPTTVIGPATQIKGTLTGDDPVDFAGTLEGDSQVTGLYRVRASGRIVGDVTAASLVVEGEVSGRTLVAEKVEIGAAARVRANVRARVVAIAEGAYFDGQVHMDNREGPADASTFTEKRKARNGPSSTGD